MEKKTRMIRRKIGKHLGYDLFIEMPSGMYYSEVDRVIASAESFVENGYKSQEFKEELKKFIS